MIRSFVCVLSAEYKPPRTLLSLDNWPEGERNDHVIASVEATSSTGLHMLAVHPDVGVPPARIFAAVKADETLSHHGTIHVPTPGRPVIAVYSRDPGVIRLNVRVLVLDRVALCGASPARSKS